MTVITKHGFPIVLLPIGKNGFLVFNLKNTFHMRHYFLLCHWLLDEIKITPACFVTTLYTFVISNFSLQLCCPLHEHAQPSLPSLSYYLPNFSTLLLFVELHPVYFKQCIIFCTIFDANHENSTPLTPWRRHYKERQGLQHNSTSLHIKGICHPRKVVFFNLQRY